MFSPRRKPVLPGYTKHVYVSQIEVRTGWVERRASSDYVLHNNNDTTTTTTTTTTNMEANSLTLGLIWCFGTKLWRRRYLTSEEKEAGIENPKQIHISNLPWVPPALPLNP